MIMKKYLLASLLSLMVLAGVVSSANAADPNTVPSSKYYGRFVVTVAQVDPPAWYISPVDKRRYYFDNEFVGYDKIKSMVLGISNANLFKIPLPGEKITGNLALRQRLSGRFLLQVQNLGRIWYVNPVDLKRYYLDGPKSVRYVIDHTGVNAEDKTLVRFNVGNNVNIASLPPGNYSGNPVSGCAFNANICSASEACIQNICINKSLLVINTTVVNTTGTTQGVGCAYGNVDCGSSYECRNNVCVMKTGCDYNNPGCATGYICQANLCVRNQYQGCAFGTSSCDINHECINNVCMLRQGCAYNNPICGTGFSCQNNVCVPDHPQGCSYGTVNCGPGYSCSNNNCVLNQTCSTSSQCASGYVCSNNTCVVNQGTNTTTTTSNRIPCLYGHPTYGEAPYCYADTEQCVNDRCVLR